MTVSAPGKLVILGDYAVLDGGLAIVAAIDRRATGQAVARDPARPAPSRVVAAVLDAGADEAGPDANDVRGVAAVVPGERGMRP